MSKVTAVGMDIVTEKSGHVVAPVTPSVCLTPAAPSPMPVPYPATGTSSEGIAGSTMRTKINGAPIATVGSALKASHGNEPGTLKEIVSHNTAGPVAPLLGAPVVLIEQGMAAIIARTNALGETASFRYDREGDLVEVENEKGELHKLSRNAGGRVVREETFDGRRIVYRYDHAGRVVRSACGDAVVELAYNAAGELTARVLDEDTVEGFTYNTRGELTRVAWTDGEVRFERDAVGRVLRELQSHKGEEHAV